MRARQWLATGVDPEEVAHLEFHAADRARFHLQNVRACRNGMRWLAWLQIAFLLAYWPTDRFLLAGVPGAIRAMGEGRLLAIGFAGLVLLACRLPDGWIEAVAWCAGLGTAAIVARTVGRIGGPSTGWFYFIHPFLMMGLLVWQRPLQRLGSTLAIGLVALAFYFLPNPQYLHDPMAASGAAHLGYAFMLSVLIGFYADRIRLRLFVLELELSRRSEALVGTVAVQTSRIEALGRRLEMVREEERAWVAHELHDEMGQVLTGMRAVVSVAQARAEAPVRRQLEELAGLLRYATAALRDLLQRLRPSVLEELGLCAAVEWLVEHSGLLAGLPHELRVRDAAEVATLSPDASVVAYRFLQEALTNVVRHAGATRVEVALGVREGAVEVEVIDDGAGFDALAAAGRSERMGLAGMKERAARVGAALEVRSAPGRGARLALRLPLRTREERP